MKKQYTGQWESIRTHKVPKWYENAKFGIMVVWGPYSVPAFAPITWELGTVPIDENWYSNNPYAEWYYNSLKVGYGPTYEYHKKIYGEDFAYENFADMWKAEKWNPESWGKLFKKAGAKYSVLTTKFHDGFCLFPSKYTEYHSMNHGPKRDIVGAFADAMRENNIKMGIYYSGLIDWKFAGDVLLSEEEYYGKACPTYEYSDYVYNQYCELIDKYKPEVFWNDIGWPKQGEFNLPYLLAHYYNTVETGVVNDRLNGLYKDYSTKEYCFGKESKREKWEMTRGMGLSFGYNAQESEESLIKVKELIRLLIETVANNGNLLLSVGPRADGTIPEEQERRLLALGKWMEINGEAIYETRCCDNEFIEHGNNAEVYFTKKGDITYVFVYSVSGNEVRVSIADRDGNIDVLDKTVGANIIRRNNRIIFEIKDFGETHDMAVFKVG